MTTLDRTLLLVTVLLAAYQIVVGINDLSTAPIIAYTIAFGVLLVAGLLLFILGFDALDAPIVVIISTVIPLTLSLGLIWQYSAPLRTLYLVFTIVGFLAIVFTRSIPAPDRFSTLVLTFVHGVAGLTIFLLPISIAMQGSARTAFALVGLGGMLIGLGGLLLSFLKAGRPILSRNIILKIFPGLLLLMAICFVAGFKFG